MRGMDSHQCTRSKHLIPDGQTKKNAVYTHRVKNITFVLYPGFPLKVSRLNCL